MTQEGIPRFALQLSVAERTSALMAQDAASTDAIPSATGLLVEPRPVSTMVCAA
jgi:hypothetical protein